jgi:hypothetical protein
MEFFPNSFRARSRLMPSQDKLLQIAARNVVLISLVADVAHAHLFASAANAARGTAQQHRNCAEIRRFCPGALHRGITNELDVTLANANWRNCRRKSLR